MRSVLFHAIVPDSAQPIGVSRRVRVQIRFTMAAAVDPRRARKFAARPM